MNIFEAVKSVFSNYANFRGRARRSEYWWWALAYIIIVVVLGFVERAVLGSGSAEVGAGDGGVSASFNAGILSGLFMLAALIPSIAVATRRLHDIDRSGWWQLLGIVPLIGWVILLYWYVKAGTPGPNRFGDPV